MAQTVQSFYRGLKKGCTVVQDKWMFRRDELLTRGGGARHLA